MPHHDDPFRFVHATHNCTIRLMHTYHLFLLRCYATCAFISCARTLLAPTTTPPPRPPPRPHPASGSPRVLPHVRRILGGGGGAAEPPQRRHPGIRSPDLPPSRGRHQDQQGSAGGRVSEQSPFRFFDCIVLLFLPPFSEFSPHLTAHLKDKRGDKLSFSSVFFGSDVSPLVATHTPCHAMPCPERLNSTPTLPTLSPRYLGGCFGRLGTSTVTGGPRRRPRASGGRPPRRPRPSRRARPSASCGGAARRRTTW